MEGLVLSPQVKCQSTYHLPPVLRHWPSQATCLSSILLSHHFSQVPVCRLWSQSHSVAKLSYRVAEIACELSQHSDA